jgi:predicted TPR repeat methyltransferase
MLEPELIQQAKSLFEQGNAAFLANDITSALDYYQQAAALRPDSGLVWQNIAACFQALGQPNAAIDALDMAVKRNPHAHEARLNLAQAYLETYQLGKAQLHFFALLQVPEHRADAHAGLGVVLMRQGKWYAAIEELAEASQARPSDVDTLINLATCHVKQQNITEAIALLTRAQSLAPDHAIANYRLAALTGTATPDRAPADYVKALFDHYADYFDKALLNHLHYRGPEQLMALLREAKIIPSPLSLAESESGRSQGASPQRTQQASNTPISLAYDLGCGTGLMGKLMAPWCQTLGGIDLSPRMLLEAEKLGCYQNLYLGDIITELANLPPANLLIAADTFCYFGDVTKLFQRLAAATQTHGYLLFSTEQLHEDGRGVYYLQKNGRYQHNVAYIKQVATQAGFSCVAHVTSDLRLEQGAQVIGDYWLWQRVL